MHDLLQAMGRQIVHQESIDNPGKRSRLWHHEDIYRVLARNMGTETITGISLDMSKIRSVHVKPDTFAKMPKLRFLKFYSPRQGENNNKVHVFQEFEYVSAELRYLYWHKCPLKSLQSYFHPENLVVLDMPHSSVEQLWNGVQQVPNLKEINLEDSKHLTSFPEMFGAVNLESLNLEGCTSLLEIPPSIECLNKLKVLKLGNCKSLGALPNCIGLESLRQLDLMGCSNVKTLSGIPCNIEILELCGTAIEQLPSSIEYLCRLVTLNLSGCSRLMSLPSSICKLKSLDRFYLWGCSKLDKLPDNLGDLKSLTLLVANETDIRQVPSSIIQLDNLEILSFMGCKGLLLPSLLGLHGLISLDLVDCGLMEIPDSVGQLSSLQSLSLGRNNFESLPTSIINLSNLVSLDVGYCERLQFLPELPWARIYAHNCTSLKALSCLSIVDKRKKTDNIPQEFPCNMALHFISFCFINCLKLDQNLLGDFVDDTLLKIQHGMEECLYKGSNETSSALICYPGSEIPNWFECQSTGSFITMELSPGWFNNKFVGFALCIIVAIREHLQKRNGLVVGCECRLQSEDGRQHVIDGTLWGWPLNGPEHIGSDHLFLGCDYQMYPHDIGVSCYTNVISLHFHLKDTTYYKCVEFCEVIKCGVRLMYVQQPEGSFRSNDEDEFWESTEKLGGSIGASVDDDEFWESMERFSASFDSDDEDDKPHPNNGISLGENSIQGN
ncbi:hypothetical protein Dsin_015618 [Dipteronia sinensis]|uniref:C-JID domain-containing protein n=1 Tax=Dipteronia sinensis TaxID=43782 RepID=A0AAE0ACS9_9ROSI|nr:hypothetical protein Dsin_015618 [Dipteronia sinensis]